MKILIGEMARSSLWHKINSVALEITVRPRWQIHGKITCLGYTYLSTYVCLWRELLSDIQKKKKERKKKKTYHACTVTELATFNKIDPHRVYCTAITKWLKFYARLVTVRVDPYTLQGKSLPVLPKLGKYSAISSDQNAIYLFILEMCK